MYSDIDNYVRKIGGMLGHNLKYPSALIKKAEHSKLVYEIKANFMSKSSLIQGLLAT